MDTGWDHTSDATYLFTPCWTTVEKGTKLSVVVDCLTHSPEVVVAQSVPDGQRLRLVGVVDPRVHGCRRLSVFGALVDFPKDLPGVVDLLLTDTTSVFAHGLRPVNDLVRVVELCAGVACSSVGLAYAGFTHVASVEWRAPFVQLHRSLHAGIPVIEGDINDPDCIRRLLQQVDPPFCMMSGIACQPYSSGGSQAGSDDVRSNTLPATLKACYLCQSPVLIIECVTQARTNKFVRAQVQQLESLGYALSEVVLKLEDQWAARRYRWWLVAMHPSFGVVQLPEWPKSPSLTIRDLMPFVKQWPTDVAQELQLSQHEIQQFTLDGSALRKYVTQLDGKLATCLHSWGSQASECPCGCRSQFSEHLIQQRGIYAQLLPVQVAEGPPCFRHFHPCELALLNAMPPPQHWMSADRPDLKLCLAAIGQLASPLQSLWVGACVMRQMCLVLQFPPTEPLDLLQNFKRDLFVCAREMFPNVQGSLTATNWVHLQYPDGTEVRALVHAQATLGGLCQAEARLTQQPSAGTWIDSTTEVPLEDTDLVAGRCLRLRVLDASAVPPAEPTGLPAPACSEMDFMDFTADPAIASALDLIAESSDAPLVDSVPDTLYGMQQLSGARLSALIPPLVTEVQTSAMIHQTVARLGSRLAILQNEGPAMGDDELTLHAESILRMSGRTDVRFLDPLLATGWLQVGSREKVGAWLAQSSALTAIATAVLHEGHWIPVVWTDGLTEVHVTIWEHQDCDIDFLCPLHGLICQAWGKPRFSIACTRRTFSRDCCGSAVVAFLAHRFLNRDLPKTSAELSDLHQELKTSFEAALRAATVVPKPWCWGLGQPDPLVLVGALLQTHGVPQAQVATRAKLVLQSLGKSEVTKAVLGVAPWKSLKMLANQQSPPLQLVLPDEQAQQSSTKNGPKPKRPAADSKRILPAKPADLDPSKLVVEPGTFCLEDDTPVNQIQFSSVGPLVSGLALVSYAEALPFLQAGRFVTNHGLALLVLHPPVDFHTALPWTTIRFAARCSANQEPMLLSGILVQLGHRMISQYRAKNTPAILAVEVACARITVYQDQWEGSWEDFAAKPVKHILHQLPCLQTCRSSSECSCMGWHPKPDQSHDALLDVFRRQFFTEAGRPVKWDKADYFAVMIRYIKELESAVIGLSGLHGFYLEPKTEDALKPNGAFQVIWMPQMDYSNAAHAAKCEVNCLGLARNGRRYGLRVKVEQFHETFTRLKPDAVFLAPGSRRTFVCGPWPFGSDRRSLATVLKSSGWECRPLQPQYHVPGGLMWAVQAVLDPPSNVLSMQHGQVVISAQDEKEAAPEPAQCVVGHAKTVQLCLASDAAAPDPWLTQDPWSRAIASAPVAPTAQPAAHVIHELEQRLEQSILAKLPTAPESMEVDDQEHRLQALEQQMHALSGRQTSLETTVKDNHAQSAAQVQSLQQQMLVQMDMQSKQMQSMMTDQMARLESILSKKPRTAE